MHYVGMDCHITTLVATHFYKFNNSFIPKQGAYSSRFCDYCGRTSLDSIINKFTDKILFIRMCVSVD